MMGVELADRLVAIEKQQGVKIDFLGALAWYTVSEMRVSRDQLEAAFQKAGIDPMHLPKPINYRDAFRCATTNAEVTGIALPNGTRLNLLVREVAVSRDEIIRHVVREVVDAAKVRLEYRPVAELKIGRDEQMRATKLVPDIGEHERNLALAAKANYQVERHAYSAKNVRDVITRILRTAAPVSVRPSGGVFFVPQAHVAVLTCLTELIADLAPFAVKADPGRARMWSVPVVDTEEQRDMIQVSLEDQVAEESASLIDELSKYLKSQQRVTTRILATYADRAKALANLVATYESMLQTDQLTARENLELVRQAVANLAGRVEATAGAVI